MEYCCSQEKMSVNRDIPTVAKAMSQILYYTRRRSSEVNNTVDSETALNCHVLSDSITDHKPPNDQSLMQDAAEPFDMAGELQTKIAGNDEVFLYRQKIRTA